MVQGQQELFTTLCKVLWDKAPEVVEQQKAEEKKEDEQRVDLVKLVFLNNLAWIREI